MNHRKNKLSKEWSCDYCLKTSRKPVSLVCEHVLCIGCASSLLKVDLQTQWESKYRIGCPKCKKTTFTYDINNLILTSSCSVTKNLSTDTEGLKRQSHVQDSHSASSSSQRSFQSKRQLLKSDSRKSEASAKHKQTTAAKTISPAPQALSPASFSKQTTVVAQPMCRTHNKLLTRFCEEHIEMLCDECCTEGEVHSKHRLIDIAKALPTILQQNIQVRRQGTFNYLSEMESKISVLLKLKQQYESSYRSLSEELGNEFAIIYQAVGEKKNELSSIIDKFFKPKLQQLDCKIADLSELRLKLKDPGLSSGFETFNKELEFYRVHCNFKVWIMQLEEEINQNAKHSLSLQRSGDIAKSIKKQIDSGLGVQIWAKVSKGRISSPSEYFSAGKRYSFSNINSDLRRQSGSGESAEERCTNRPSSKISHQAMSASSLQKQKKLKQYGF